MSDPNSSRWRPLRAAGGSASEPFQASPFTRLARVHALSIAGDALIALALAGSLFFSIDPSSARWRVGLYLVLTMAPFAVVAPLIGPAIDRARGGRRWMIVLSALLRVVVGLFMIGHLDSLLLFPEAFAMLVLGKGYQVAKSAVVPTTVATDAELVEANSKLSLLTGVSGLLAAIPGWILLQVGGSEWVVGFAVFMFGLAAALGLALPSTAIAPEPVGQAEREELRASGIRLAASAMGLLRGIVGFLAFTLAFAFRSDDEPTWYFGVAIVASVMGSVTGSLLAPRLRATTREEDMLIGALAVATVGGLGMAVLGGLAGAAGAAAAIGFAANTGKLAFDSIVQRDAPDANRGRSFARFETRFQIIWVIGAVIPVVVPIPARIGYLIIAGAAGFAAFTYFVGRRAIDAGTHPPGWSGVSSPREQTGSGAGPPRRSWSRRKKRPPAEGSQSPMEKSPTREAGGRVGGRWRRAGRSGPSP